MIQKDDLGKIMNFVAGRWVKESRDTDSRLMADLPNEFWMNSVGGKTANGGFWVTTLMYTENEADAAAFKEVLLRWQTRGSTPAATGNKGGSDSGPDLIQISRMKADKKDDRSEKSQSDSPR